MTRNTLESARTSEQASDQPEDTAGVSREDAVKLFEKADQMEREVRHLADTKARLEVHRVALRLIVAESLKDYHEQFQMILSKKDMTVDKVGPELLDLNRESLKLQLDISKIQQPTEEEQRNIEEKVSERLMARLGNLASPEAPKTAGNRKMQASPDSRLIGDQHTGGRSTAISTQRPGEGGNRAIMSNSVMSPQTNSRRDPGSKRPSSGQNAGQAMDGSNSAHTSSDRQQVSKDRSQPNVAPSADQPLSAKQKILS